MTVEASRELFSSRFGTLMTMIGVAAGLGNIWRFPYMVGRYGGAAFVLFYLLAVLAIGVPALMAEWALGRATRRGPVGAFARGGLPFGRAVGWFFFVVMTMGAAYYTAVLGWVLFYGLAQLFAGLGGGIDASAILPPQTGFDPRSFFLQMSCTGLVVAACVLMLLKGLRSGIERASRLIIPALFLTLLVLILRSVTLPGAIEGIRWYILKFDPGAISARVIVAALGQAVFSLSLGATFMVVYGSYLRPGDDLRVNAFGTAFGDTMVGLLAGLAIFPAVFALGMEPASGPGLLFSTLPEMFGRMPLGWIFGLLFFGGLFGAAYLSDVAGFEVLVAGLTDNTSLDRRRAIWLMAAVVFLCALPPSLNMAVFVPWDLTFGSGMQTLGTLLVVLTVGWAFRRAPALRELSSGRDERTFLLLYYWLRYVVPGAVLAVGIWWVLTDLLGLVSGA